MLTSVWQIPQADEPDQDLVRARLVELDLLEGERTVGGLGDGGLDDHRRTI